MDILQTLQLEVIGLGIGALAFGRWMIDYVKRSLAENARADLVTELRNQISKLEVRVNKCEHRSLSYPKRVRI